MTDNYTIQCPVDGARPESITLEFTDRTVTYSGFVKAYAAASIVYPTVLEYENKEIVE